MSTTLAPLHRLLCKDNKWKWSKAQAEAFKKAKDLLQSSSLLVHFGKPFTLYSEHQPLKHLLSESRQIPVMVSSRIQRWALSAYQYTIQHRPGTKMANADALSRLPLPESPSSVPIPGDINVVLDHLSQNVVSASQIKTWTGKDPVLARVRHLVQTGWTISDPGPDIHPYF